MVSEFEYACPTHISGGGGEEGKRGEAEEMGREIRTFLGAGQERERGEEE